MADEKIKRCFAHDYHERCIYLVTVSVVDRKPILGRVTGTAEKAWMELSAVGLAVCAEIGKIRERWLQVKVLQYQVMPDHVHLVLFVQQRLPEQYPLGNIVAAWKQACGRAYSDLRDLKAAPPDNNAGQQSGDAAFRPPYRPLFAKGFNDSILTGRGQLQRMMAYVRDNPRRLLIKQQHRGYFHIRRGHLLGGTKCDAIGNMDLLKRPLLAVHCRRHWTEAEHKAFFDHCLAAAQRGVVLVGAYISPHEKAIQREAECRRLPIIQLLDNGIPDLYKPYGEAFYAMAEGRLLQATPFAYHASEQPITRQQCNLLNDLAETIAAGV